MTTETGQAYSSAPFTTDVPARLDRLPWSRFHRLVVVALGITWILDGLEVTLVSAIGAVLQEPGTLGLSTFEVGAAGTVYLAGSVSGALVFGFLTDLFGRKRLFLVTLGLYLVATVLTGLAWNFWSFALFRFFTGAGIGGEYAAINSAIDELIPARRRGWTDLAINGSYWLGAAAGAGATVLLVDTTWLPADLSWRLVFLIGGVLALAVLLVRRNMPESPRWLLTHGRPQEAERITADIEARVEAEIGAPLEPVEAGILIHPRRRTSLRAVASTLFLRYPRRAVVGFTMMVSQAFFYNAIFFTYALVLTSFYDVDATDVGLFLLPFAAGNFLGPLLMGPLFDSIGRRRMIATTYALSAVLLVATGVLFVTEQLDAVTQTLAWTIVFFFASPAASSAYLTVSEVFPLETRAMGIAVFYSIGTATGGVLAPIIFGALIATGDRSDVFVGYVVGAVLMLIAAVVAGLWGVDAERKSLEEIAPPITSVESVPLGGR